ncbi:unnamed protein product [Orchesella dallaii]|uniref:N-acetyltransferase domain-containing protein n=1 Tax=Orchesella dallaii TaxID=48710 RepID=A0ABP1Q9G8_9HEXA
MPDNYHLIEGPIGDKYTVRRVRCEDVEKVATHIKEYFLHDEPISKLCGYTENYGDDFIFYFKYFLADGMSFWVEDNETGEVVAVRAICHEKMEVNPWITFPKTSRAAQIFIDIGEIVHDMEDIYEKYQLSESADLLLSSCAPKYRNQGISKELYKRAINFLTAEGFKMVKSVFTSPYSRAGIKNLGFEEVNRLYYKDLKDENGNPVFDTSKLDSESYAALMVKLL